MSEVEENCELCSYHYEQGKMDGAIQQKELMMRQLKVVLSMPVSSEEKVNFLELYYLPFEEQIKE